MLNALALASNELPSDAKTSEFRLFIAAAAAELLDELIVLICVIASAEVSVDYFKAS